MEVKKGYKQTEVGIIPNDWTCLSLGEVVEIKVGRDLINERFSTIMDSTFQFPVYSNTVSDFGLYGYYSEPEYSGESVTVVGRGVGLGTAFSRTGGFGAIGRLLVLITPPNINAVYLTTYINHCVCIFVETGGIPQLTGVQFSKYLVALPTLAEQRAIATALSDADAWIESLEQLIAKKRQIKQGAMQVLLTGKTRLPGFSSSKPKFKQTEVGLIPEDWGVAKIETIISEISMGPFGSNIKVSNFVQEGVPVLSGASIRTERLLDGFQNFVSPAKAKSLKKAVARRGDIVVTHRGTLGQIAYISEESEFESYVISQSQFRVRFHEQFSTPCWVVLYFHSERGANALLEGKGHSGVPAIAQATTTFKNLHLPLPQLAEQRAIATALSDMDGEIAMLESKLSKARHIKQGMMQELLTGRIRLV